MDPNRCKRTIRIRNKHITIRITEDISKWLRQNNYSPTAVFNEAIKDLGYKRDKK